MKVLVTGGAGFIASHVVDRLLAGGHRVAVVDDLSTGRREFADPRAPLHAVDIRSRELARVFEAERPEAVIHLAAQTEVRRSVADPEFDAAVNIGGTLNLLLCCRRHRVGRVVYASTGGAMYGDAATLPTPEDHPARPASPYGISKLVAEQYLACWGALYGLGGISLRYANVFGPRQNPLGEAGVVAIFSHRLLRGEPITINGDGEQTRDYVYVEDVADATLRALEHADAGGALNIGTGVETSVNALLRRLERVAGARAEARHGPARPGEQRRSVLDASAAKRILGWTPQVTLDEGLRRTLAYFKEENRP
ncbi:MAG: NAD-dependent epimerase/dehydratase family protein [Candidatus Rokubacteria bacterium]|nr:NAD-dependent epimerase/dehydratase family protein [Candidatus Rokubacteria bacterium]